MAVTGNTRRIYIGVTSGSGTSATTTYTWLTGEQSNSFNLTQEQIEVTDKSSSWQDFIGGKKGASIEATVFTDNTDTQQKAVINSIVAGTKVKVFVGTLTGTSSQTLSEGDACEALVTSVSDTNDVGAVASRSISLVSCGEVTHYPTT